MTTRSEIRDACIASLRAARLREQPARDYVPATEAAALLERFGSAWAARDHARRVALTLDAIVQEEDQAAKATTTTKTERTGTE